MTGNQLNESRRRFRQQLRRLAKLNKYTEVKIGKYSEMGQAAFFNTDRATARELLGLVQIIERTSINWKVEQRNRKKQKALEKQYTLF